MNKLTCILLLCASSGVHFAAAADRTARPAPANAESSPAPVEPITPATIEPKNKSAFAFEANSRNPFWPIGWKPTPKSATAAPNEQAGPEIAPSAFLVSSIMMGQGSRFAIINGKPMQEGQVFGLQVGTQVYQITVKSIEDGQVILQRRDQELAVPLRRK